MDDQQARTANILRIAAGIDLLIALALVATPFMREQVGLPITLAIGGMLAMGALVILFIASRMQS